jgi:hypothetical protein
MTVVGNFALTNTIKEKMLKVWSTEKLLYVLVKDS